MINELQSALYNKEERVGGIILSTNSYIVEGNDEIYFM